MLLVLCSILALANAQSWASAKAFTDTGCAAADLQSKTFHPLFLFLFLLWLLSPTLPLILADNLPSLLPSLCCCQEHCDVLRIRNMLRHLGYRVGPKRLQPEPASDPFQSRRLCHVHEGRLQCCGYPTFCRLRLWRVVHCQSSGPNQLFVHLQRHWSL